MVIVFQIFSLPIINCRSTELLPKVPEKSRKIHFTPDYITVFIKFDELRSIISYRSRTINSFNAFWRWNMFGDYPGYLISMVLPFLWVRKSPLKLFRQYWKCSFRPNWKNNNKSNKKVGNNFFSGCNYLKIYLRRFK